VVTKVKWLHTELRSDFEGPPKGVEQTGGSRSGGIVTVVDENEHDMKLPRGVVRKRVTTAKRLRSLGSRLPGVFGVLT
jgi:hypothetical protein